jgi:hypothetical protein
VAAKATTSKLNRVPLSPSSVHASSSSPPPPVDATEEEFWTTPARTKRSGGGTAQPRALRFIEDENMLTDERMELGDMSVMTFGMATPAAAATHGRPTGLARSLGLDEDVSGEGGEEVSSGESSAPPSPTPPSAISLPKDDDDEEVGLDEDDAEKTVVLPKRVSSLARSEEARASSRHGRQASASPLPSISSQHASPGSVSDEDKKPSGKIRITSDVERIVVSLPSYSLFLWFTKAHVCF